MAANFFRIDSKKKWLVIFLLYTASALWNLGIFVTDNLASREPARFRFHLINELSGAYSGLALLPFILWFFRKFPINRKNCPTRIPLYLLFSLVYGVLDTLMMYASRNTIYWLFQLGTYDYGQLAYRALMEYHKQLIGFWLIFGIVYSLKTIREKQEQKLRATQLEQQLTQARLQALQMQLHPHFLFNTLNMISSTMYEDVKTADTMIANLSDLLRLTLKNTGSEEYPLEKELEFLSLYLAIMKARFQDKLVIQMEISENTRTASVPGLILQPLIENSIKHSLSDVHQTKVVISSRRQDNWLVLAVRDNGSGITGDPGQIKKNGVGWSNTVERLETLYGPRHRFLVENLPEGGLQVVIHIPFRLLSDRMNG